MYNMYSLSGKVAIVTGGGSGLGEATAKLLAKNGAKVAVVDYNGLSSSRVGAEINKAGHTAMSIYVNVANREGVDNMFDFVTKNLGKPTILVNNAGIIKDNKFEEMTEQEWLDVLNVNLTGVFNCTQAVVGGMKEEGFGRIITISSISRGGNFGQTNYAATKAGVVGMSNTWAREFGKYGITSNCIAPGFIKTPMTASMPEKILEMMAKKVPVKRLGEPDDIANLVAFLASENSSYINGTTIDINGGLTI